MLYKRGSNKPLPWFIPIACRDESELVLKCLEPQILESSLPWCICYNENTITLCYVHCKLTKLELVTLNSWWSILISWRWMDGLICKSFPFRCEEKQRVVYLLCYILSPFWKIKWINGAIAVVWPVCTKHIPQIRDCRWSMHHSCWCMTTTDT